MKVSFIDLPSPSFAVYSYTATDALPRSGYDFFFVRLGASWPAWHISCDSVSVAGGRFRWLGVLHLIWGFHRFSYLEPVRTPIPLRRQSRGPLSRLCHLDPS